MKPDLIGIVEAIYQDAPDDQTWLHGVATAAEPALDLGLGTMAYTFAADPKVGVEVLQTVARGRHGEQLLRTALNMVTEQGPNAMPGFKSQVGLLRSITDYVGSDFVPRHFRAVGGVGNAVDVLGVVGADSNGRGMVLASLVPPHWQLTPTLRQRWRCIISHLVSGQRLRRVGEALPDEAVLDAGGKLYDAVGTATSRDARVALRQAARAIDCARVRRARSPDAALATWQALVHGRWSLVDRFESDGRTFLIAKANPPEPPAVAKLTPRESAVVALAALGRSNKLIAYELGLSLGTVGTYLLRAQRRLNLHSRAALIRWFFLACAPVSGDVSS
jgi:DNA-binding CsgD family transcriptional regulator